MENMENIGNISALMRKSVGYTSARQLETLLVENFFGLMHENPLEKMGRKGR